jgi:hypothetical protein
MRWLVAFNSLSQSNVSSVGRHTFVVAKLVVIHKENIAKKIGILQVGREAKKACHITTIYGFQTCPLKIWKNVTTKSNKYEQNHFTLAC